MDRNLVALKPALVWKHFAEIVRIPRPSSHEEKIRRYILDFARAQGLESKEDAAHNVYVRKPASKGMEDRKGVILQAHLDMVPQKNNDKEFDFTKDPIDAYIDGGWVTADGTTLGADNGIGVAAILAVLEDRTLKHGPLEALFTATEETGMDGANGLEKGLLHGDILLNLDSEEEGELYVGCAGGLDANMTFGYKAEPTPAGGYTAAKISVKGLKGGHSGIQIVCQRANANKLLFRFLNAAPCDVLLASVDGGGLRNAIPREAEAVVLVETGDYDEFAAAVKAYEETVRAEYAGIEDSVSVKVAEVGKPAEMLPKEVAGNLIKAVAACPDGVQRMSVAMPGLVQTSTNLARVVSDGKTVKLQCLLRSSVGTEKEALGEAIAAVMKNFLNYSKSATQAKYLGNTLVKTAPLLLCALSILFSYKVGLFNIGAAGQYCAGVALSLYAALAWGWGWLPCMLLAMLGGMVLGAISGLLKSYCNVNEVISGIMLNWIVLYLTNMLLTNVKEETSPYTFVLAHKNPSAVLPTLGLGSLLNDNQYVGLALPLSILAAVLVWVVLEKTRFGYELRATGNNKNAAKYCGMAEKRNIILTLVISGALAGMGAAMLYLTGYEQWQCSTSSVPGMGFNGIAAAFLGGLNPFGTILASFFIQHITAGGAYVDKTMYCAQISDLISALIIYLCGFVLFMKYAMNSAISKREEKAALKKREQSETPPADANTEKGGDQ